MPRTGLTTEEVKEKAIGAAERKIRKLGFDKFRLVDIAKELGVAHTSLYNHFPDKSALLEAVAEKWICSMDAPLNKIAQQDKTPKKLIEEWLITLHHLKRKKVLNDSELLRAFYSGAKTKKPFVLKHIQFLEEQLQSIVQKSIAAGEIREQSSLKATRILIDATQSFTHFPAVLEFIKVDREPALKNIVRVLLNGLS
jgi:AcrR family transcriptional regulator